MEIVQARFHVVKQPFPGGRRPGDVPDLSRLTGENAGDEAGGLRPGDVVECRSCGYVFVFRSSAAASSACRRCDRGSVVKWNPAA